MTVRPVKPGRRRPTMRDIASSLGISVNTVSRALANKDAVHEHTRDAVCAEADRLGYVPNHAARSLVTRNAMTIGLVITNPSNPFYARLIGAIEERGRVRGYSLTLMVSEDNVRNEQRAAEELMRWGVDGVLAVPVQHDEDHWLRLHNSGIPLVLVNRHLRDLDISLVGVDYERTAAEATRLMLADQPEDILLIEEDLGISPVAERIRGFTAALSEHGRRPGDGSVLRVPSRRRDSNTQPWDPIDAYQLGQRLAPRLRPRSAIICGNDYFALGLYRAFGEAGLRIPRDVAIIGHGDHPFAAYLDPSLSSVALPAEQVGRVAADRLLDRLEVDDDPTHGEEPRTAGGRAGLPEAAHTDAADATEPVLLPAELVTRDSMRTDSMRRQDGGSGG